MKNTTFQWIGIVVAIVLATLAILGGGGMPGAGGTTATSTTASIYVTAGLRAGADGLRVGTSGTYNGRYDAGTCIIWAASNTIAATSTATIECTSNGTETGLLTGVSNGDAVFVTLSTSTPSVSLFGGLQVLGASASSTTGTIVLKVFNATGNTFTWTAAASSTSYLAIKPTI
jgi:hypothetical protein